MTNDDIIQRFMFDNANVRGEIVRLTKSFQTITHQHAYPSSVQKLIGQVLAVACLLSSIIKIKGRLSVQFQGKEPLKLLLAQCDHDYNLRGLAKWQGDLTEEEAKSALKNGLLSIIISPDTSTTPYQGVVAWQGNSLAESIEGYFRDSEQLPTRIWLAINETSVAGMLLQPLPAEGQKKSQAVQGDEAWNHLVHLAETITPEELLTLDNATILYRLYSQEEVRIFPPDPTQFACACSTQRSENALLMLGKEEIEDELANKQVISVTCEFCNKEYPFDRVDVARILNKGGHPPSNQQVH